MIWTRERSFYRAFCVLTGMIALQNMINYGVNLADNLMLGSYSELAMSGVAVANQIQYLLQQTANGIGAGAIVIAAQYWGKKQPQPIRRVFAVVFWLGLAISSCMAVIAFCCPERVLGLLTNEAQVIASGAPYMRILSFSYPIFMATTLLLSILRSVETIRIGLWVSCLSLFISIGFNYLFIFGHFGFPALGVRGAAYATLLSRCAQLLVTLWYVRFRDRKLCLRLRDMLAVEKGYVRDVCKTGLPLALSSVSWGVAINVQSAILGRLGAAAIGANAIATTLFQVVSVVTYASANASSVLVGKAVGEGNIPRVKTYTKTLQLLFLAIGLCSGLLLFVSRGWIVSLYSASDQTQALARQFILVLSVTVIGTSYQMAVLSGIVSGGGDTKFVLLNDLLFMWSIVLPLSAVSAFVLHFPPLLTFICLKSDQILKCAVAVVKVNRFRWIRVLTREKLQ